MRKIYSMICSFIVVSLMTGLLVVATPSIILEAKIANSTEQNTITTSLKGGSVKEGKTKKLTLKVSKDGGKTWIKGTDLKNEFGKITWKSSDKGVATVSGKGKVKGIKAGSVTITAKTKKGGISASCKITVKGANGYTIDKNGLCKITLSGKTENHFITDRASYVEGDKFILLIEKDVDLPGDLSKNVGLIIDKLEELIGLTYDGWEDPREYDYKNEFLAESNPWEGIKIGKKVPIYIWVDRNDEHYISGANELYTSIYDYALFSDDVWNSVPSYRNNAWRRANGVDYHMIAHELTHTLTDRYTSLNEIMTEGSADYFGYETVKALAKDNNEFDRTLKETYLDTNVGIEITSKNAESVFLDDFSELSFADRGAQYVLGRYICEYLYKAYGPNFMRDYVLAVKKSGFNGLYGIYTDKDKQQLTDVFKKVFGKNVFEKFGKWYQSEGRFSD